MGLYPNNSQGLAEWLVNTIDPMVNFANYDNNSDGVVDGIIIVHSGRGFETSGNVLDIASHSWGLLNALWKDGVWVSSYCMVPEYRYNVSPNDNTVGVLSHEFGHILGLPDLYDTGYDSNGLGKWSLMAWGVYNGNRGGTDTLSGVSPAFLDAWSRVFLGYVTPVNVTCFLNNQMILPVEDTAMVFRLWNNGNMGPEYFLVENRNTTYTDTALATYGLLIYHVDENQPNNDNQWWPGQPPANHYKVALEQADGAYDLERNVNRMDFWDPFNGGAFDYSSSPSSRDYYNNPTNVSITEILGGGVGMADLDVGGTAPPGVPIISYPDDGYATNYVLLGGGWYVVPCASRYGIQFDDDISFSSPVVDDTTLAYNYYSYSFLHQPDGIYYWRVKAGNSAGWSGWSEVRSQFLDRQIPYGTIASSPDTAHSSSFTVSWTAGIDPPPSSGICSYSVICDSGAGPAWYWQLNVQGQSAVFTEARNGNTYLFCAMAHDCALNQELWNWQFECTTYVEISGCAYRIGDINNVAPANGIDVTYGVSYLKGGNPPPVNCSPPCPQPAPFYAAMDVNGTCNTNGIDITYFVGFLKGGPALMFCPTCPPAGRVAGGSIDAGDY
jgi:M6 family metalloprotease-like protein